MWDWFIALYQILNLEKTAEEINEETLLRLQGHDVPVDKESKSKCGNIIRQICWALEN